MDFKGYIDSRLKDDKSRSLWKRLLELIDDCLNHLAQVTTQMPTYDIHDVNHSEKVQENIFNLIALKKDKLTEYELILLYACSYFHDSGMALPEWEFELLKAAEGTEDVHDNTIMIASADGSLRNDLKPPMSLVDIRKYIRNNKEALYGDFLESKDFIFTPKSERKLQEELANRVQRYQEFRSQYTIELQEKLNNLVDYIELSNEIRCDFIRSTHHIRGKEYILSIQKNLSSVLNERESAQFVSDLANICWAHCEEFGQVLSLGNSYLPTLGGANLSFVGVLLRLGDIIHHDEKRAPKSLRAEKRIANSSSLPHWLGKNSVDYQIIASDDLVKIRFSAFCKEPDSYYNLKRHLDAIDNELAHYSTFKSSVSSGKESDRYDLLLDSKVDRQDVAWDTEVFRPGPDVAFTMNQSSIVDLLAGTSLYADKYLCIRELYQNSLDACKCMMAEAESQSYKESCQIEFGLEKNEKGELCLYCLDNGIGMNDHIINNYFLKIGDSYYTSKEFVGRNTEWGNRVHPTSQFGIGALSCFMMGPRIEVITKHYADEAKTIGFTIDNANNRFYYIPVDPLNKERIGRHGTLLRVVLDEVTQTELCADLPNDLEKMVYWSSHGHYREASPAVMQFEKSLFYKVNSQVALPHDGIKVLVRAEDETLHEIIPHNTYFKPDKEWVTRKFLEDDCGIQFWGPANVDHIQNALTYGPSTEVITLQQECKGINLISIISVPRKEIGFYSNSIFSLNSFLWLSHESSIYIDGIFVSDNGMHDMLRDVFGSSIMSDARCMIDFRGNLRPSLTADRKSIINYSDELRQSLIELANKIPSMVADGLVSYFDSHDLRFNSESASLAIKHALGKFRDFSGGIMKRLAEGPFSETNLLSLTSSSKETIPLRKLIDESQLEIQDFDSRELDSISEEALLGKLFGAKGIRVQDMSVSVDAGSFSPPTIISKPGGKAFSHSNGWAVLADSWEGEFAEFDIVTQLWPLVPKRLFQKIRTGYQGFDNNLILDRIKTVDRVRNGVWGISQLSSALISRRYNITTSQNTPFGEKAEQIGEPGVLLKQFFFNELQHVCVQNDTNGSEYDYALYAFVSPDSLTESQKTKLKELTYEGDYADGVEKGWSVLILEGGKYFFEPGIQRKDDLIEKAKNDLLQSDSFYLDLEGNEIF